VILFNPITRDEACAHAQYLENIGKKKVKPGGSKKNEYREDSKDSKKKRKGGKYKNTKTTTHQCKDPNKNCNHYIIDEYTEEK
jgi:hypothetical protein